MKPIGRYGSYTVSEAFESKRFFVKIKDEDGTEKSVPVRRTKRYVQLRHDKGDIVLFTIYVHQGQTRYRDSRDKRSFVTPDHNVAEAMRMLEVTKDEAKNLMSLYPQTASADDGE